MAGTSRHLARLSAFRGADGEVRKGDDAANGGVTSAKGATALVA